MKLVKTIAMSVLASGLFLTSAAFAGDVAKGAKVFKKKCQSCHTIEVGSKHKVGPNLAGFLNRAAGSAEGYRYSKRLKKADFMWDDEKLDQWLKNPKKMIKGTKMVLKVKKKKERENVIAYLNSLK